MTANKLVSTVRWKRFRRPVSWLDTVYIIVPPAPGKRHDVCTLQSHRPSWCKCFAEMKHRTSIYYVLAAAHENILSPLTITVYMRQHNLLPQMDASVWVRGHARQSWLADENEWGYKRDFLSLALTHCGHLRTIFSPLLQDSCGKDMSTWYSVVNNKINAIYRRFKNHTHAAIES